MIRKTLLVFFMAIFGVGAMSAPAMALTNAQILGMQVPAPATATQGGNATVKVFTYSGTKCTLNGNQTTAIYNTTGGWKSWTFKVNYTGRFPMKVWCAKGTVGAAILQYLIVNPSTKTWQNLVTYNGTGAWEGPDTYIAPATYRISYYYRCTNATDAFFLVGWQGTPAEHFEFLGRGVQSASGFLYGYEGARTGYVIVDTNDDCSWTASIQTWR